MIHEGFPDVLVVGPVADRSFSDDGQLVIDYGTAPRWSPDATLPDLVARAKLLALLLDALDPEVDVRVGARHQFLLNDHIDGRVDTRAGGHSEGAGDPVGSDEGERVGPIAEIDREG